VSRAHRIVVALLLASACRNDEPAARLAIEPRAVTLQHGRCATVTVKWEMLRPLDRLRGHPWVFVHLLERAHKVKRTYDHALPVHAASSIEYPFDLCQSLLAPPLPPGRYIVSAGLFDNEWGYRWPLATNGEHLGEREYAIGTVTIAPGGESGRLEFRGGWSAPENIADRQIVVRRTARRDATIVIAERAAESIRLALRVNGSAGLSTTCAAGARELSGGDHVLVLPACDKGEIRLQPHAGTLLSLESVAWSGSTRQP
jgi:hypothetical protein